MIDEVLQPAQEVLPPERDAVRLVSAPHVFAPAKLRDAVPYGLTVAEIVDRAGLRVDPLIHARVWIDDVLVPAEWWTRVRPKAGRTVTVKAIAHGGGAGGKNPLRLLLQVAVLAASFFLPPLLGISAGATILGVSAQALAGAAIGAAGMLAVNLLVPPTQPKLPSSGDTSQTYSLTGGSNQIAQYGPIPVLLGRHRIVPPYAATPYTELVGKDQYLRAMFLLGHGPITVSDLRLGDTPITSFRDVEVEIREGRPTDPPRVLYTQDIDEQQLNIRLVGGASGGWYERATGIDADEISIDFTFPFGLVRIDNSGDRYSRDETVEIQYRPIAGGSWVTPPGAPIKVEAKTGETIRRGLRWAVPRGQYMVRLRKPGGDTEPEDGKGSDIIFWTALRTIRSIDPIQVPNVATVAIRVRANDQLNGTLDPFNCIAQAEYPDWTGASWESRATRNPASAFRHVLQGPGIRRALPDGRIDLAGLADFHAWCAQKGYTFDAYLDSDGTVMETLRLIAAAGRAAPAIIEGKHGVVIDRPLDTPVQMLTARNSWGFKATKVMRRAPHGLRIRFVNEDRDWQQDERTVYADGYDEATATEFETDEAFGVTNADTIWKLGRYRLAQQILRPETFEVWTDVENLVVTRGDLVLLSRDTILVGLGTGRIVSIETAGGGAVSAVTLDERIVCAPGKSYAVVVRTVSHGIVSRAVVNPASADPVETDTFTLVSTIPSGVLADPTEPGGGDLVSFGEAGLETIEAIVTRITPGPDLTAKLTLMAAAPGVHTADQGAIPAWTSGITHPTRPAWRAPEAPVVAGIRSDEAVLLREQDGSLTTRILISLAPRTPGVGAVASAIQVRIRETGLDEWRLLPPYLGEAAEIGITDVDDRGTYDIELRAVSDTNRASAWTRIDAHYVIGKSTPPPPVPAAWRLPDGRIDWTYPSPPRDHWGFVIRSFAGTGTGSASEWDTATPAHPSVLAGGPYDVRHIGYGVRTVLIKAIDVAGNVSADAARIVIDFGDPSVEFLIDETDYHPAWPGLLPAGSIESDEIVGVSTTQFWRAQSGRAFWTGVGSAPFWGSGGFGAIDYWFTYTPAEAARLTVDLDINAPQGWVLEWCEADDFLFWAGGDDVPWWTDEQGGSPSQNDDDIWWTGIDDGDWRAWPGAADVDTREYLFRLRAAGGTTQPSVTTLTMRLDVTIVTEHLDDIPIADTGTRLPITGDYREITSVLLTLQEDGGTAVSFRVVDKDHNDGPLVEVYDGAGAMTTGTVDALIRGARA